jgi:alanine racemase
MAFPGPTTRAIDELDQPPELRLIRPHRAAPADAARVTRAEINLAYVRHNLHELRACLRAEEAPAKIWAVLKADGYGHGARAVATTLEHAGVDGLCVALLEEGIELREAGVRCPVLVMGGYYGRFRDGLEALVEHRITPVVYDAEQIEALASTVRYMRREPIRVHLKVDSGMGRLGVRPNELASIASLAGVRELEVEALMTHLACADSHEGLEVVDAQLDLFDRATEELRGMGIAPSLRHAANSAAMLRSRRARYDIVRPGIAIFGVHPCSEKMPSPSTLNLKPAMRVISEIVALRDLPAGTSIGYGHTWTAERASRIATIPMGYADGLHRSLSNRGEVLVCGKRAPIVGTVSMDLTMIDVTDIPPATLRDEVVIVGEQRGPLGLDSIGAAEIAARTDTISWEFLTSISRRVPRFYRHP